MVGSSLSFTHCIVFELYTAPPLTIHTTLWGHWFCADSILNSWKVICYVGCETLGWWNWHEEARGSSKIYWDGRVAFWCMYVLIGILYMFWTLPTVFILINFIKYLNYKIQYTVICKCLKCCSLVFDSFTIMFALLSRFFFFAILILVFICVVAKLVPVRYGIKKLQFLSTIVLRNVSQSSPSMNMSNKICKHF